MDISNSGIARSIAEEEALRDTAIKMSAFAGSLDLTGAASAATLASSRALLGDWRTLPDLPADYWTDRGRRTRLYREAEVDEGVVEADAGALIDVLVDSGMVEGTRTRSGATVAIVHAGPVRVRIAARHARAGTYEAIDSLDRALKALIDRILCAEVGELWFKHHVHGDVVARAKETRRQAMLANEPSMPLVYYLDLGQLIDIVRDKRHWKFFEPIFVDSEAFGVNLRRLNTIRRPTMHGRGIDQVQVLEAVMLVNRFNEAMARSGRLDEGWNEDR